MSKLAWDDSFSVHNSTIDSQHQKLFDYVNEFDAAVASGADTKTLLAVIEKVLDYTAYHFSEEEKLMEKGGYPEIERHKLLHKQLIEKAVSARDQIASGLDNAAIDTQNFLSFWLKSHIRGVDTRYTDYV